uniref:NADH-ubiquinone oxidoreductase chain 1 n=1 Tax=Ihlea magalhanica TaxID=2781116 RepID=A0AA86IJQ8_9UROC|nr:NADH dehydrogenase subunit 1 [Ihlea magalhanica]
MFFIFLYAGMILAVAFLVLSERAILGLAQIRKGPNIVGPWGLVQCVGDGVKLMTKGKINLSPTSVFIYAFAPALLVVLTLLLISLTPMPVPIINMGSSMVMFFCFLALMTLPFLLLGLTYGSFYSTLGAVRVAGLMMSYEILMMLLFMFYKGPLGDWSWDNSNSPHNSYSYFSVQLFFFIPMLILWLMELGRTPFDLAEGESELVSGFNVEYGGWGFLLFFFSEMLCLLMMSVMFASFITMMSLALNSMLMMVLFVSSSLYIRAALPRFRLVDTQNFIWFRVTPYVMLVGILYFTILFTL